MKIRLPNGIRRRASKTKMVENVESIFVPQPRKHRERRHSEIRIMRIKKDEVNVNIRLSYLEVQLISTFCKYSFNPAGLVKLQGHIKWTHFM